MPLIVAQEIFPHLTPDDVLTAAPEYFVQQEGNLRHHSVRVYVKLPVELTEGRLPGTILVAVHYTRLAPEEMTMMH